MGPIKQLPGTPATACRFLTVRKVADELDVSQYTVRRLIHDGILVGVRVGSVLRVPRSSLEDYLDEQRVAAK
jgi:excisionase family DNA binding protein